jgi:LysR family hydrogen peroxide-inducible transcriptional activator
MTLQQLEYALTLEKYGSYSRAAKMIGITQPAISLQVKKLEEMTGITLFDRSKKPIKPTYEGALFLERARMLLTQASQLHEFAVELNGEFAGEIKIGIIPTLAPYLLPLFITDLNTKFPQLKVRIVELITEEILEGVKAGDLHAGIISTPIKSKTKYQIRSLFYEKFLLFISDKHPLYRKEKVKVADVPYQDLWLLKEGNCFRDQVNNICEIAKDSNANELFYYESNSIEALSRIVEYRGGITFLPELTTLHFGEDKVDMIKEIEGKEQVREISLIHLPNEVRHQILNNICDVILENIPKKLLSKEGKIPIPTNIEN